MDIRIRSRDQMAESSVEKSGIIKTKESKDVEVEGQGDAPRFLTSRDRPIRVSTTGSNSESICVQGDPPAPHEISPRQEEGSVGEQRLDASPWQRPCSQCPEHPTVSGGEERANPGTTAVFARLGPL